ncbi:hypothetical protein A6V39_05255 [Candidatus Mycoplasma haematobovis]|uniref:Uncharacterized protein n=1 Tax=Candidatus Mycoplasma haematobovis TaxID=432608 RepID=A0A1A9QCZ3_9MOLU|nr:hypothetical protein [Candidatus Mycoplasma haematobovis]OAL09836.1 hypothetical protein A6V39_05255 [Candidatus Mycoplasma haematobovis]
MSPVGFKVSVAIGGLAALSGTATYFFTRTTIEQQLVSEGLTLISDNKDYKFVLFTYKDDEELKKALSSKETLDFNTKITDIEKWCKETLKQWTSNGKLLKNAKTWCIIPKVKILKDRIKETLNKPKVWQTHFTKLVGTSETENKLLAALNAISTKPTLTKDSSNGGTVLDGWCTSALDQKIYEIDKTYKTEENVTNWCFETA